IGMNPVTASSITVKLAYAGLFLTVLIVLIWMSESALKSPWGRMMRAIRDNEVAAGAMGKDVTRRHLQIFILGSAVVGIAGAMMTTLDGQLTPASYQPLRYTFLVWVMVIVGGSGNNWGAVLGGFIIWFFWNEVEPIAYWSISHLTSFMSDDSPLKLHLLHSTAHLKMFTMGLIMLLVKMFTMGLIMLLVLRFSPRGLIPEK
ncbi:MAG: branched-chain amino acid ABC transporter permease, partial [Maritimibacter sp.]